MQHLDVGAEREIYEEHENDPGDPRYLDYLRTLAGPVRARIRKGARGLDYGCGPAPAMAAAFGMGYVLTHYDPLYFPRKEVLKGTYDFITCCEAAEHFFEPSKEFDRLAQLLLQGGVLGIRTEPRPEDFENWWYQRDPTHVSLYSETTMEWIARRYGWRLEFVAPNVFLFIKH